MPYIKLEDLQKFPIRKNHCDKEHGNAHFIYGIETVFEYAEYLPTYDVVPRTEVETLQKKYEAAVAERNANVKGFTETINDIRSEVAKEIFAKINEIVTENYNKHIFNSDLYDTEKEAVMDFEVDISYAFDELKKKYTGESE